MYTFTLLHINNFFLFLCIENEIEYYILKVGDLKDSGKLYYNVLIETLFCQHINISICLLQ